MIFISNTAYIFYVPASDIANNMLDMIGNNIIQTVENTDALTREPTPIYIFIEQPSQRWEIAVASCMQRLELYFEPDTTVHSFLLPTEVYKKMNDKHSSVLTAPKM